jgi:ABC-2 type transport system permease protein
LTCFSLCTLGFSVAWWLDSTAGYHVVMSLVLLPLWILSGAMFPGSAGAIELVQRFNPMAYAVSAVRRGLYGGAAPEGSLVAGSSLVVEMLVLGGFCALVVGLATLVIHRRR